MQVIEEFIHIVGLGMKDFHNAYLMTGNLGKILEDCFQVPMGVSVIFSVNEVHHTF